MQTLIPGQHEYIVIFFNVYFCHRACPSLQNLWGQRQNFHIILVPELSGDRPEDTGTARILVFFDNDGSIFVKLDVRSVRTTDTFLDLTITALTTSPFLTTPPGAPP